MDTYALALFFSFAIERLTEYVFGTPLNKKPEWRRYKWLLMYISLAFGVGLAFAFRLDMVAPIVGGEQTIPGLLISGLAMGGGGNILHQIFGKYTLTKQG